MPFAEQGVTIDMQPLADADPDFDLSDVYPNMLGLSRVGGEGLYMIPSSYDVVTMYYNKTMFDKAGVAYPTDRMSFEDFRALCEKLTVPGVQYGYGIAASKNDPAPSRACPPTRNVAPRATASATRSPVLATARGSISGPMVTPVLNPGPVA